MVRAIARRVFAFLPPNAQTKIGSYIKQRRNFSILARRYGQFATMRDWRSVDAAGAPIPWYTYPAIEYLSHLELSGMKVFEFGSGNSSLWWLRRCSTLTAVEDDPEWHETILSAAGADARFTYIFEQNAAKYAHTLASGEFDIVIIDGKYRPQCAEHFLTVRKHACSGAMMLLFDNADWYPETIRRLRAELEWLQVDFHGFGPINDYTSTTTIFLDPTQAGRIKYRTDLRSVAWLAQGAEGDRAQPGGAAGKQ